MNAAQAKRHDAKFQDTEAVQLRLKNFAQELAASFAQGKAQVSTESMGQTDPVFFIDAIIQSLQESALTAMTPEKRTLLRRQRSKAMFLETLKADGGLYTSAETATQLGVSKVTVKNRKDSQRLLALQIDGEFYYPVFQFTSDSAISDRGVLKGLHELLAGLQHISDRMQYSFFMETRTTPLDGLEPGRAYSVTELLKENPGPELMAELFRLVRLYGKQDAA